MKIMLTLPSDFIPVHRLFANNLQIRQQEVIWMGPVRVRHSSHDFGWQASHSVDLAGWQAKMASIEIWIPWCNAHKPHCQLSQTRAMSRHRSPVLHWRIIIAVFSQIGLRSKEKLERPRSFLFSMYSVSLKGHSSPAPTRCHVARSES